MNIKLFQAQPCRVYSSLAEGLGAYLLANMAQRLFWIDNVKAICMIGVYLLHSEAYYGFGDYSSECLSHHFTLMLSFL